MSLLKKIFYKIKLIIFRKKWRNKNESNYTYAKNVFPISKVKVGKYTYGQLEVYTYGNSEEFLEIGNFCSIGPDVMFLLAGEHNYKSLSTFPLKRYFFGENESICKGKINIKDDVWIGARCTILSGVEIGQGAVIGAGSIVTKDVPPYAIYAGGKITKYRFKPEIIEKLLKFDFLKLNEDIIKDNIQELCKDISEENIDTILYKFNHITGKNE